jgi:hypothetical protein
MALKLNAWVARGLHGKNKVYPDENVMYDEETNPLATFRNHFRESRMFTTDVIGLKLWEELLPIIGDPAMP